MEKIIIRLNMLGAWSIQTGSADSSLVMLKPGINEIPMTEWNKIKNHPVVKERMNKKVLDPNPNIKKNRGKVLLLEIITKDAPSLEEKEENRDSEPSIDVDQVENEAVSGISGLNVTQAKELIAETYDLSLLKSWLEDETRVKAKAALEKKIKELEAEREESKDDE